MTYSDTTIKRVVPTRELYVNWLPENARHAMSIFERGGPLVDSDTGRVIMMAPLPTDIWTQLVDLPEGVTPEPAPPDQPAPRPSALPAFVQLAKAAWQTTTPTIA